MVGRLVPIEALSTWRRDLTIGGYPQVVQTTVADQTIPFLRARSICAQLGATILDSFTIVPKRISGSTVISRQLIYQSSPDIEDFVANDIANAISVAVDNAAINGIGGTPRPVNIRPARVDGIMQDA